MAPFREFDPALGDDLMIRASLAWSGLVGTISLELFGHFTGVFEDPAIYFDHAVQRLAIA
jgi:hypothetical protein